MRWRLTGTVAYVDNVRRPWRTVPSLTQLLVQVDAVYPVRHPADGTAAGQGHFSTNPKSDHTPDVNGDVRAGDIGEVVEDDAFTVAEAIRLSRDPRIKYVIHERRLFSSYDHANGPPYTWRPYSGSNPHSSHVHISVLRTNQNDRTAWDIGTPTTTKGHEMLPLRPDSAPEDVRSLQGRLNTAYGSGIKENAVWGDTTSAAVKANLLDYTGSDEAGDEDVQEGIKVNARMWNGLLADLIKKGNPARSGMSESQVKQLIETHAVNPDAHHA